MTGNVILYHLCVTTAHLNHIQLPLLVLLKYTVILESCYRCYRAVILAKRRLQKVFKNREPIIMASVFWRKAFIS